MRPESDENKCRLCLSIGSSIPIYPTSIVEQGDLENIDEKIRFIANSIKISRDDGLPQSICEACKDKLESAYYFRLEIESNDYKLRKMVKRPASKIKTLKVTESRPIQAIQPIQSTQPMNISIEDEIYYVVEENILEEINENKSEVEFSEVADDVQEAQSEKKFKPKTSQSPKAKSKDKIKELTCKECSKVFKRATQLQVHLRSHTNFRPFPCSVKDCGKAFRLNHHLQSHQRVHDSKKPYPCTYCDKQFTEHSSLLRHTKIHTNDKRYHCPEKSCGMAFITPSDLRKHSNKHSGSKPFCCKFNGCNKSYSDPSSLSKHKKKHLTSEES